MTGRHMTLRADCNTEAHVAFGGPIFYGHAASGFNEEVHHPGNVFWHQAEEANKRALAWIEQELGPLLAGPATAMAGPVIVHTLA